MACGFTTALALGQSYTITTLAGVPASVSPGWADGTGSAARFNSPTGLAVDASGNVYVADYSNATIRKISPRGEVTTLAGQPGAFAAADGIGANARVRPVALGVDAAGTLYVADQSQTIRRVAPDGTVTTVAGTAGQSGSADGVGAAARFQFPSGIAVDPAGQIYVAESGNHTIRKITPDGTVTTLAGRAGAAGIVDGTGPDARFQNPGRLTLDATGQILVADAGNRAIRRVSPTGVVTTLSRVPLFASNYPVDESADAVTAVAVDRSGQVYAVDRAAHVILSIAPSGNATVLAGRAGRAGSADGRGDTARFYGPIDLVADPSGNLFVVDRSNSIIRRVTSDGTVTTFAGLAASSGSADGPGAQARFARPAAVALDAAGNMFIADLRGIRKVTPAGVVSTFYDSGSMYFFARGLAFDRAGNLYASFSSSIERISPAGVWSTFVGGSTWGSADGTGGNASFYFPWGLAFDASGNLYVTDLGNRTVRKVTPAGVVTTLAGQAGKEGSSDGPGPTARFMMPKGIAVDGAGNVFVADYSNNTIRQISPAGVVTTFAGQTGRGGGGDGVGTAAQFDGPDGLRIDPAGNLFVADNFRGKIRRISREGVVTTLAGSWIPPTSRETKDGTGNEAVLFDPVDLALDRDGTLYVVETSNNLLRRGVPAPGRNFLSIAAQPESVLARPSGDATLSVAVESNLAPLTYQWKVDGIALPAATQATYTIGSATGNDTGFYSVVVGNGVTSVESTVATVTVAVPGSSRLANVSSLGHVPAGGEAATGVTVRGPVSLVVRAVGPGLAPFGVTSALNDPVLEFSPAGSRPPLAMNDNWGGSVDLAAAFAAVGAFALPGASRDAAVLAALNPPATAGYTLRVTGANPADSGLVLSEVFDRASSTGRVSNLSIRGLVGRAGTPLVLGFNIAGPAPKQLLVRAIGPGLAPFGVSDFLADPRLAISPSGRPFTVATSDNWTPPSIAVPAANVNPNLPEPGAAPPVLPPGTPPVNPPATGPIPLLGIREAFTRAGAFPLASGSLDAAIVVSLPPGSYTVVASGPAGATGTVLIEIYDLDP